MNIVLIWNTVKRDRVELWWGAALGWRPHQLSLNEFGTEFGGEFTWGWIFLEMSFPRHELLLGWFTLGMSCPAGRIFLGDENLSKGGDEFFWGESVWEWNIHKPYISHICNDASKNCVGLLLASWSNTYIEFVVFCAVKLYIFLLPLVVCHMHKKQATTLFVTQTTCRLYTTVNVYWYISS